MEHAYQIPFRHVYRQDVELLLILASRSGPTRSAPCRQQVAAPRSLDGATHKAPRYPSRSRSRSPRPVRRFTEPVVRTAQELAGAIRTDGAADLRLTGQLGGLSVAVVAASMRISHLSAAAADHEKHDEQIGHHELHRVAGCGPLIRPSVASAHRCCSDDELVLPGLRP